MADNEKVPARGLHAHGEDRPRASLRHYVAMGRPDHWIKHIFIVPGVVLAYLSQPEDPGLVARRFLIGMLSACLAASANYVVNEWLDAASDLHHPSKSARPAVTRRLSPWIVVAEYALLATLAVVAAGAVSRLFVFCIAAFLFSALIYNVPPIRTKDTAYLDVLTEAVNNPIRLTLGWAMVSPTTLPPSSLLIAYWMGGAFLMAVKRFAEFRAADVAGSLEALALYRRSFRTYTEPRLLIAAFLCAQMAAFFLAVFLIKYRIEYILSMPLFAVLFAAYLNVGLKPDSTAQKPEKLLTEKALMGVLVLLVGTLALLTFVDVPLLDRLTDPRILSFELG